MIKKYKEVWVPLLCFILIAILLLINFILPIDLWVYDKITHIMCTPVTNILKVITFFGDTKTIIIFSIIWALYLYKNDKKELKPFISMLVITMVSILLFKTIFARERPDILRLITIDGYSFPSGHSVISVAFYAYLATYILENKNISKWFSLIFIGLILGIGFSRIYLGVHYFSDVLAGYSLGFCILGIHNILRRRN